MSIRILFLSTIALVTSCGNEPVIGPITSMRCNTAADCPTHLPECLAYTHNGYTGSLCTSSCDDFADCQIDNAAGIRTCVKVTNGMHDPVNGQGHCFEVCDNESFYCSNDTIYDCAALENDEAPAICVPKNGEF